VWHDSHTTFPGAATFVWDALTFRAGTSGLVIPDFALNVQSGPDRTPWVELDSVVLRGTPTVGSTLSVRNAGGRLGGASRTPGATVSYQWLRGEERIEGATGPQYTLTEEDLHHFVGARITVRAPGHVTDSDDTGWVFVETGG